MSLHWSERASRNGEARADRPATADVLKVGFLVACLSKSAARLDQHGDSADIRPPLEQAREGMSDE